MDFKLVSDYAPRGDQVTAARLIVTAESRRQ